MHIMWRLGWSCAVNFCFYFYFYFLFFLPFFLAGLGQFLCYILRTTQFCFQGICFKLLLIGYESQFNACSRRFNLPLSKDTCIRLVSKEQTHSIEYFDIVRVLPAIQFYCRSCFAPSWDPVEYIIGILKTKKSVVTWFWKSHRQPFVLLIIMIFEAYFSD